MNDRIKLAEAMKLDAYPKGFEMYEDGDERKYAGFEPFTDANDDYAVLEWMRGKYAENEDNIAWDSEWFTFKDTLGQVIDYKIGDYARAAVKVLP